MAKKAKPMSDQDYIDALPDWVKNMPRTPENLEFLQEQTRTINHVNDAIDGVLRTLKKTLKTKINDLKR